MTHVCTLALDLSAHSRVNEYPDAGNPWLPDALSTMSPAFATSRLFQSYASFQCQPLLLYGHRSPSRFAKYAHAEFLHAILALCPATLQSASPAQSHSSDAVADLRHPTFLPETVAGYSYRS